MDFGGKTVALDFDGPVHSYTSGWTGSTPTDPPVDGAREFIVTLLAANAKVIIYSSRAAEPAGYAGILNWMRKHGFPDLEVTDRKPAAIAYVDDRAVRFRLSTTGKGNWAACIDEIEELAAVRTRA